MMRVKVRQFRIKVRQVSDGVWVRVRVGLGLELGKGFVLGFWVRD